MYMEEYNSEELLSRIMLLEQELQSKDKVNLTYDLFLCRSKNCFCINSES